MKCCIFSFLFVLFFIPLKAQVTFNKLIDNGHHYERGLSLLYENDSLYLTGYTSMSFTFYGIFFKNVDLMGNVNYSKEYLDTCVFYFISSPNGLDTFDSNFTLGATVQICDSLFPVGVNSKATIFTFNHIGDTISTYRFAGFGFAAGLYVCPNSHHEMLLAGYTHDTILTQDYGYLIKADQNGIPMWERTYEFDDYTIPYSVAAFIDGNILLSGATNKLPSLEKGDGFIAKLDSNGTVIWNRRIGTIDDDYASFLKISKDEKNILTRQSIDTVINEGDANMPDYMGKLDSNGHFIWRTFFNQMYTIDIWGFREIENKNIMVVGNEASATGDRLGWICKLDSNGIVLWERTYCVRKDADNYFTDIAELPDKGFALTGSAWNATDQDVWLVRLDSMGCMVPGCGATAITENNPVAVDAYLQIYPNPMSSSAVAAIKIPNDFDIIPGQTISLDIINQAGQRVDHYANIPVSNSGETLRFNIYRKNLPAGLYAVQFVYAGKIVSNVKLVVQ